MLLPTDTGIVVTDFLMQYFPTIMDYNFTAEVEKEFDAIAEGKEEWAGMIKEFWNRFEPLVDKTIQTKTEHRAGERVLGTDPVSGSTKTATVESGEYADFFVYDSEQNGEKCDIVTNSLKILLLAITSGVINPIGIYLRRSEETSGMQR